MKFKDKEAFTEWLGNMISDKLNIDGVYMEVGSYGRCNLIIELEDQSTVKLNVSMTNNEGMEV